MADTRSVSPAAPERGAASGGPGAAKGAGDPGRLGEGLRVPADGPPELRMTRVFDAPRRRVFEAWRRAEQLSRWFTPAPLTTPSCEVDLRTGGLFRLVMRTPDGIEYPMDALFTEVVPEERIAFAATIHGGVDVKTTIALAEHDGRTTMSVHQTYSRLSDAVRGAPAGWAQTLDQLGALLRERG